MKKFKTFQIFQTREAIIILSGISNLRQLEDNICIFQNAQSNCLSDREREICKIYNSIEDIPCTGCNYCMDCTQGLDIPQIFDIFNSITRSNNQFINKLKYKRLVSGKNNIHKCIGCGNCAKRCPQNIAVHNKMHEIKEYLEFHYGHL